MSDDAAKRRAVQKAKANRRAAIAAAALATPEGLVLLEMIENEAGYKQTSYTRGDPHDTSYRNGKRDIAVFLHEMIDQAQRNAGGIDDG